MRSRIIATGDWHIRATAPRSRIDNYAETQFNKITWICEQAESLNADIVIAGDVFDMPRCPLWLLNRYIQLFTGLKIDIYAIPGQHDMHQHNPDISATALGLLFYTNTLIRLDPTDTPVAGFGFGTDAVDQEGVIVAHMCVTPGEPPFYLPDAVSAMDYARTLPSSHLIITGDYHPYHMLEGEDQLLLNVGTIMRNTKTMQDFEPGVWLVDRVKGKLLECLYIPVKADVFDQRLIEHDERAAAREQMKQLFQRIRAVDGGTSGITIDFPETVKFLEDSVELSSLEREILHDTMDKVNH